MENNLIEPTPEEIKQMREEVLRWIEATEKKSVPPKKSVVAIAKARLAKGAEVYQKPLAVAPRPEPAARRPSRVKGAFSGWRKKITWVMKTFRPSVRSKALVISASKVFVPAPEKLRTLKTHSHQKPWLHAILYGALLLTVAGLVGFFVLARSGAPGARFIQGIFPRRALTIDGQDISQRELDRGSAVIVALNDWYPADAVWHISDDTPLNNFIRLEILREQSRRRGYTFSEAAVARSEELNRVIRENAISDHEAERYYFAPVSFSRLLVRDLKAGDSGYRDAKTQAEVVHRDWTQGRIIFEKLVNADSRIQVNEYGFVPRQEFLAEYPELANLAVGAVSPILESLKSFTLVRISDRLPELDLLSYRKIEIEFGTDFKKIFTDLVSDSVID